MENKYLSDYLLLSIFVKCRYYRHLDCDIIIRGVDLIEAGYYAISHNVYNIDSVNVGHNNALNVAEAHEMEVFHVNDFKIWLRSYNLNQLLSD